MLNGIFNRIAAVRVCISLYSIGLVYIEKEVDLTLLCARVYVIFSSAFRWWLGRQQYTGKLVV